VVLIGCVAFLRPSPANYGLATPSPPGSAPLLVEESAELDDEVVLDDDEALAMAQSIDGMYYASIMDLLRACFRSGRFYAITLNIMAMTAMNEAEGDAGVSFLSNNR
jgi:hypothetical protein